MLILLIIENLYQLQKKIRATRHEFHNTLVNGSKEAVDAGYVVDTFDGLRKLLAGTSNEFHSTIDVSTGAKRTSAGHDLLDELDARSALALSAAEAGSWTEAETSAALLITRWQKAETYAQGFIRHPDIDAISDALTAFRGAVMSQDVDACRTAALSVSTRLSSIRKAETPSLGSIF